MLARIARLWRGEETLARTFWEYAILYGTLANVIVTIGMFAAIAAKAPEWAIAVLYVLTVPYNVFVVVAVWRSAGRYRGAPEWAMLARIAVIAWALAASLS